MNDQQKRNVEILIERAIAKAQKEQWGDFAYIPDFFRAGDNSISMREVAFGVQRLQAF